MFKHKLNWKRPVFYLVLPLLLVMAFLGVTSRAAASDEGAARAIGFAQKTQAQGLIKLFCVDALATAAASFHDAPLPFFATGPAPQALQTPDCIELTVAKVFKNCR
jgi:hypothetical protein